MENTMNFKGVPTAICPEFFLDKCFWALQYHCYGFTVIAWELTVRLKDYFTNDAKAIDELTCLESSKEIIAWFRHYTPLSMALVPKAEWKNFVEGVRCATSMHWISVEPVS